MTVKLAQPMVTPAALPPGPPGHFLVGNLPEFSADVLNYPVRCHEQYGGVVMLSMGNLLFYLVNDPELIHHVLVTHHRDFIKHNFFWRHVRRIFGQGLLTNESDSWLRQRRLAAPAFHRDRVVSYGETMVAYTERMLESWQDGERRNVHQDMMGLTLEIVAKVLFNADVETDVDAVRTSFDAVTDEIAVRFRRPIFIPDWVPLPGNFRYMRGVRALDTLVYRIIREHRARGAAGTNLLAMLMQARDEDGGQMSDQQLRDEAVTLLLAGHETTALVLSWTWDLLARNPAAEQAVWEELDRVLAGRAPTPADLPALRYTEHVIFESMRLRPPAYGFGREAVRDLTLGKFAVPKGTTIFLSPWVMHRDPRWFEDPLQFRPERWADGLADRLPRHVYMPFGGGPRICIGNSFAMMEAVLLLATIARTFRIAPTSASPVEPFPTITLRPRGGVWARVQRRD
jgi:cytochrome P450